MNSISKPTIVKDVIESLTFSMYEDSRFIFREYIQNSADQIDKAVMLGILPSIQDGYIDICIERSNRKITIEDNATGIKESEVVTVKGYAAVPASTVDLVKISPRAEAVKRNLQVRNRE